MKTLYSILFASLALTAGATSPAETQEFRSNPSPVENQKRFTGETDFHGQQLKVNTDAFKVKTRDSSNIRTEVITQAPGEPKMYAKACGGTKYSWLFGLQMYEAIYPSQIYWDGNDVYFPNLIFNPPYNGESFIHGTKTGDNIEVPVPQTVIWYEQEQYGYNIAVLRFNPDAADGSSYVLDETVTSFSYKIGEDGSLTMVLPEEFDGENLPEYVLGIVYTDIDPDFDKAWVGYCDMYQTFTPFTDEQVVMPDGKDTESYSLITGEYGYKVNVLFQGSDVYFQGLSQEMPEAVVKGTVINDGDDSGEMIISIAQNQYVGIYNDETFVYTKNVYINPDFNPEDENSIYILQAPEDQGYELIYNPEKQTFVSADDIHYLDFNSGNGRVTYISLLEPFHMLQQDEYSGTPSNPHSLIIDDTMTDSFGFVLFYFTLPGISTSGRLLDGEGLYYSVFVDDDKLEFEEDEIVALNGYDSQIYWDVTEPTDILPSWFDNWWDIAKLSETDYRIGLYMEGFTTVGVQAYYTYDDVTTESAIITLNVETGEITGDDTGVESIKDAYVTAVEYFDLNGRKIINPEKGIFIKKATLSNGKVMVKKVAR